jgi:hypothetical protein
VVGWVEQPREGDNDMKKRRVMRLLAWVMAASVAVATPGIIPSAVETVYAADEPTAFVKGAYYELLTKVSSGSDEKYYHAEDVDDGEAKSSSEPVTGANLYLVEISGNTNGYAAYTPASEDNMVAVKKNSDDKYYLAKDFSDGTLSDGASEIDVSGFKLYSKATDTDAVDENCYIDVTDKLISSITAADDNTSIAAGTTQDQLSYYVELTVAGKSKKINDKTKITAALNEYKLSISEFDLDTDQYYYKNGNEIDVITGVVTTEDLKSKGVITTATLDVTYTEETSNEQAESTDIKDYTLSLTDSKGNAFTTASYTGSAITPDKIVLSKDAESIEVDETNFDVTYKYDGDENATEKADVKKIGTVTVSVTPKGESNFTNSGELAKTATYKIKLVAEITNENLGDTTVTITKIADETYTYLYGYATEEKGEVTYPEPNSNVITGLEKDTPYWFYVKAVDKNDSSTEIEKSDPTAVRTLKNPSIAKAEVTLEEEPNNITYDGTEKTPEVVSIKIGETTIKKAEFGENYTVTYENNTNAGTATVKIAATETNVDYSGYVTKDFTIDKADLTNITVSISNGKIVVKTDPEDESIYDNEGNLTDAVCVEYTSAATNSQEEAEKATWTKERPTETGSYKVRVSLPNGTTNLNASDKKYVSSDTLEIEGTSSFVVPVVTATDKTTETTTTTTNASGNTVTVTTTTTKDETGAVIGTTEKSEIANIAADTSASVTVNKNASGTITAAAADVSTTVSTSKLAISGAVVSQLTEAAGTKDVQVTVTAKDESGNTKFTVKADADELTAGNKLKIYVLKDDGTYEMVNAKTYTVTKAGNVSVSMTENKTYELVTEAEANAINKQIKATVKVAKSSASVKKGKKTTVKMSSKLNMNNVKKITYSSTKKSVATVNKNGKVTAKKKGTATVKAKVTLKNGTTKTVSMKIKVK